MTNNFVAYGGKIIVELIGDFLYFPLWWYTRGLIMIANKNLEFIKNREKGLAFFVWARNIFKPMYGQSDWQGWLISFFMRLVQIIFRGILMLIWLIISASVVLLWVIMPIFIFAQIFFQFL